MVGPVRMGCTFTWANGLLFLGTSDLLPSTLPQMLSTAPNCHQNRHHPENLHIAKFSYHHDVQPWAPSEHSLCLLWGDLSKGFITVMPSSSLSGLISQIWITSVNCHSKERFHWRGPGCLLSTANIFSALDSESKLSQEQPKSIFEGLLDFSWKSQSQNPIAFTILVFQAPRKQPTELQAEGFCSPKFTCHCKPLSDT